MEHVASLTNQSLTNQRRRRSASVTDAEEAGGAPPRKDDVGGLKAPIIAGQFFLYDVFKGLMHVTANDLTLFLDAMLPYR